MKVTWHPAALPSATPVEFDTDHDADYRLLRLSGFGTPPSVPYSSKAPSQEGESALDVTIGPRNLTLEALIRGSDEADVWAKRSTLERAMVNVPVRFGESLDLGRLLIERTALADREIYAIPRPVDPVWMRGPHLLAVDAEFYCPYPYFQATADTELALAPDDAETATNSGDVDAPIVARIYGPATEVTLRNMTTGESFTVAVSLADDTEWLAVNTAPGVKTVRKYTDEDTWTNAISGLDLTDARLFLLRPGNSSLKLEAEGDDANTNAVVSWRPRYAGL